MQMTSDRINVVVLAGGINHIPLYEGYTSGYKALLPLQDKPAIQYTLNALRAVPRIQRIGIVGPEAELHSALEPDTQAYDYIPGGETLMDSITHGLQHFSDSSAVLITTADLPLLTAEAITDFLSRCSRIKTRYQANIYLPAVPERCYTGAYASFTKPFNRFKDGAVCHGNMALVTPRLLQNEAAISRMNQIYSARKSPITSALAIGWKVGLSYIIGVHLLHALTIRQMARIASRRFKIGFIPVLMEYPEITIDVDEAADYEFVARQLEGMAATHS